MFATLCLRFDLFAMLANVIFYDKIFAVVNFQMKQPLGLVFKQRKQILFPTLKALKMAAACGEYSNVMM